MNYEPLDSLPFDDTLPPDHRSGYVAVIGQPNVGKSTLMNRLLGEKLAIVSPKPQTTRDNQLGILTLPNAQIIFVDTPGIHEPRTRLGAFMLDRATETIPDADVILFLVDVSHMPDETDRRIAGLIAGQSEKPVILLMNKSDLVPADKLQARTDAYCELLPSAHAVVVSALRGENCDEVLNLLIELLPHGPRYFPEDQLTETHLRDSAGEIIREQALMLFGDEVPHAMAVKIDEFKERDKEMTYIGATIYVERDSQKGIVIGKKGEALRRLGQQARAELEHMLGTKVYLELWVKVLKNWRKDERALKELGYQRRR